MAFTQKLISVQFNLANGSFGGGGNTANISGLRVSCQIQNTGGASQSNMQLAVYGLPLSLMNQLSTVGPETYRQNKNGIAVLAGDASGMSLVFQGNIYNAFVDTLGMPDVCLRVSAMPGTYHAVKPATPISIQGAADVSGMMSKLASTMGFGFEDAGVKVKLSNPYFGGTAWTQAHAIARHAGIDWIIDRGTMVIVPPGQSRQGDTPLISPQTGLIAYPQFNQNQILVRALFNPAVKFYGNIQVQSDLSSACGTWKVQSLRYDLESMIPKGAWFMDITANALGPSPS